MKFKILSIISMLSIFANLVAQGPSQYVVSAFTFGFDKQNILLEPLTADQSQKWYDVIDNVRNYVKKNVSVEYSTKPNWFKDIAISLVGEGTKQGLLKDASIAFLNAIKTIYNSYISAAITDKGLIKSGVKLPRDMAKIDRAKLTKNLSNIWQDVIKKNGVDNYYKFLKATVGQLEDMQKNKSVKRESNQDVLKTLYITASHLELIGEKILKSYTKLQEAFGQK